MPANGRWDLIRRLKVNIMKASNMPRSNMYASATSTSALTGFPVRPAWHVFRLRYEQKFGGRCESGIGRDFVGLGYQEIMIYNGSVPLLVSFNLEAPCVLVYRTGVSLLSRERFLYI